MRIIVIYDYNSYKIYTWDMDLFYKFKKYTDIFKKLLTLTNI